MHNTIPTSTRQQLTTPTRPYTDQNTDQSHDNYKHACIAHFPSSLAKTICFSSSSAQLCLPNRRNLTLCNKH